MAKTSKLYGTHKISKKEVVIQKGSAEEIKKLQKDLEALPEQMHCYEKLRVE